MTPVFLSMLADRQGRPGALLWRGAAVAEMPEMLGELAGKLPCFYAPDAAPELAGALDAAGWQALPGEALARCDAGFAPEQWPQAQWFAGRWPLQAPLTDGAPQAASRSLALQLVQLVSQDADTHEIEALLRRDPTLSYHLLKLVNSLGMSTGRRITSFNQAILILGRAQLRRWLNLMLFAARDNDVRSPMLLALVAVRARLMELLARETGLGRQVQEQAFMVGMFSLLGVLFGMPLATLLAPLDLGEATRQALLQGDGELGELLRVVEAAEQGQLTEDALAALPLSAPAFQAAVAEANLWMLSVTADVGGNG